MIFAALPTRDWVADIIIIAGVIGIGIAAYILRRRSLRESKTAFRNSALRSAERSKFRRERQAKPSAEISHDD